MIREVTRDDIPVCVDIIRKSFKTVAEEFGFTIDNAPGFTAFATTEIHGICNYRRAFVLANG